MDERVNRIGFIGLGRMGGPIARNILSAGFKLTIYDLRSESAVELIARGATFALSPRAVAKQSAIVALAVVDDAQVDDVLTGAEGVFAGAESRNNRRGSQHRVAGIDKALGRERQSERRSCYRRAG